MAYDRYDPRRRPSEQWRGSDEGFRDRDLRADAYVTFQLAPDGTVDQVKLAPESREVDFSFDFQDLLFEPVH
jgi:hypothetical protein